MTDIVERLRRFHAEIVASDGAESEQMKMTREAADEIERLRAHEAALVNTGKDMDREIEQLRAERDGLKKRVEYLLELQAEAKKSP